VVYAGLDYPTGGRLAALDLAMRYAASRWEVMSRAGISATPAVYANTIFFADERGAVFAVNEDKAPAWALERSSFETDGSIVADLRADEGGLYVASMDGKLYCLDTGTGRVRWQYYASVPLVDSPAVTPDTVYQTIPGVGVAAIDKTQGKPNRDAKWVAAGATRFLSQDEKFVYLRGSDRRIMACDRATGEIKFRSQRNDFVAFAINTKTSMIYASTREGRVMGVMPVTKPGTVGTLVLAPVVTPQLAVALASR
jgi:outer membrane protein assembly factor BamB